MANRSELVFITGITGFTGRHLADDLLCRGFHVCGISNQKISNNLNYPVIEGDLLNFQELTYTLSQIKPDYIIHLAALAHSQSGQPLQYYETNVLATDNLVKAIIIATPGIKKLIAPSTALVYGKDQAGIFAEDAALWPTGHYAWSKLVMEKLLHDYFQRLPILVTRPFNYFGPGQDTTFVVPKIVSHFAEKKSTIELGNTWPRREFNNIHAVCEIYYKLMVSPATADYVNVCTGITYSIDDILDILAGMTGHRIEVIGNPLYARDGEPPLIAGDKTKMEKIIGPIVATDIKISLNELYQWFLKNRIQ